jgi:hypothetical protein
VIGGLQQKPRQAVVDILDFMRSRGLTLDDLIQIGGEDLKASNPKRVEKARREMLEFDGASRRRRGEGHFSEAIVNTRVSETFTHHTKPNEINDLADSAPVGDPQLNPGSTE